MMANESAINLLSQKLEVLPLADNYFSIKPTKITRLFCFSRDTVKNPRKRYPNKQKHVYTTNNDGVLYFNHTFSEDMNNEKEDCLQLPQTNCSYPAKDYQNKETQNSHLEVAPNESTEGNQRVNTPTNVDTTENKTQNESVVSPILGDGLSIPGRKRSPNKRKRSIEIFTFDTPCHTKSCDLEVLNIFKTDFRSIQRTLSFDEELLRSSHDELENLCVNSAKVTRKTLSRPSVNLERMTCRSQPSSWWEEPKGRKVKVLQLRLEKNTKPCGMHLKSSSGFSSANNEDHIFEPITNAADPHS